MMRARLGLAAAAALIVASIVLARLGAFAQEGSAKPAPKGMRFVRPLRPQPATSISIQDALLVPCDIEYAADTTLERIAADLHQLVGGPVVLDPAALKRQKLTPQSTLGLKVAGVRLKVALKLLLEQAGLAYRVEAEDNLLLITDQQGTGESTDRILTELRDLHRDLHDVQDAVEELYQSLAPAEGEMRKPTIIEEVPDDKKPKPPARTRPG
jgi:hypothetical protein